MCGSLAKGDLVNCPLCDSGETRVLRTIPGSIVSREHFCFCCCARWWSDQCLRQGSVRPRDRIDTGYQQATGSSTELTSSQGIDLDYKPEPESKSHSRSNLAGARVADLGPIVFEFPVVGNPEEPTWAIRQTQDAELKAAFPDIDLPTQYARAKVWLEANRSKRKTAKGMMTFLFRWMDRTQNRGNSAPSVRPEAVPFQVRAEQARGHRLLEAKVRRVEEELAPKQPTLSPRQIWGGKT